MSTALKAVEPQTSPVIVPARTADRWLDLIERVAVDPTVSVERIEQMYDLMKRDRAAHAEREFASAMATAQAEIAPVAKNQRNTHTNSRYADLAAIADAVQPIYSKHGFSLTFQTEQPDAASVTIIGDLLHASGHQRRLSISLPLDSAGSGGKVNKTILQATGSTVTYGRRYLTCMAFNIATADTDGNAPPKPRAEPISEEQAMAIRDWLEVLNVTAEKFCAHHKIDAVTDLPVTEFDGAISSFKRMKAKREQAATS